MTDAIHHQINRKFAPLSNDGEIIAFDLESRSLVLKSDAKICVARLSRIEAHLLLALVYFYPYDVPDSLLAQGYLIETLSLYSERLEQEKISPGAWEATPSITDDIIQDGIERLRRKLKTLGMTIHRMLNRGYALRREARVETTE